MGHQRRFRGEDDSPNVGAFVGRGAGNFGRGLDHRGDGGGNFDRIGAGRADDGGQLRTDCRRSDCSVRTAQSEYSGGKCRHDCDGCRPRYFHRCEPDGCRWHGRCTGECERARFWRRYYRRQHERHAIRNRRGHRNVDCRTGHDFHHGRHCARRWYPCRWQRLCGRVKQLCPDRCRDLNRCFGRRGRRGRYAGRGRSWILRLRYRPVRGDDLWQQRDVGRDPNRRRQQRHRRFYRRLRLYRSRWRANIDIRDGDGWRYYNRGRCKGCLRFRFL